MFKLLIVILLLYFIYNMKFVQKISIDLKSFRRKGFKAIENQFGVFCYTGKQGSGKSLSAIKFVSERKLKDNCIIITNVSSFKVFQDTIYIYDINDLIDYVIRYYDNWVATHGKDEPPNIIIFFDEIFSVLTKQTKMTEDILLFLSQLRKRHILFVTTCQEWLELNVTLRRYVKYQCDVHMIKMPLTREAILINEINDGDNIKWDKDANEYVCPRIMTKISKANLMYAESYDTFETIKTKNKTHLIDKDKNILKLPESV